MTTKPIYPTEHFSFSEVMEDNVPASSTKNCSFTFKSRRGRGGRSAVVRKRGNSSDSSSSEDETSVVRAERKSFKNPLIQKSSGFKKRKAEGGASDSSSDADDKTKSTGVTYSSKGAVIDKSDQNATAVRQLDTEVEKDQRSITERAEKVHEETRGKEDDKVYRGMNNYAQYIDKKESLVGKRITVKGPIRAPTNIRSTVRWDYDPMICKDYKETGYCGFGDSCKFLHDRSDYKFGWQLEREENEKDPEEGDSDDEKYVINSDDDDLPVKCPLCRQVFKTPVVTRCKHYFCEKCALDHYRKSQRCFSCGKQTSGMFNPAKDLIERMAKREAAGKVYDDSDDDDERLPDESTNTIPEDDPDYYSKVHDPYEDDPNAHESY